MAIHFDLGTILKSLEQLRNLPQCGRLPKIRSVPVNSPAEHEALLGLRENGGRQLHS